MRALREQPAWHIEHGDRSYEFTRVYERDARVVKADGGSVDRQVAGLSRWTVLRHDVERDDPHMRVDEESITYDEYREAFGKDAVSLAAFASPLLDPALIDDWMRNRDRHLLRRKHAERAQEAAPPPAIGHWAMR